MRLRDCCAPQGWTVTNEYIEQASGKTSEPVALKRLFEDASPRAFDTVLVSALVRFKREGVLETFEHVRWLTTWASHSSYTLSNTFVPRVLPGS